MFSFFKTMKISEALSTAGYRLNRVMEVLKGSPFLGSWMAAREFLERQGIPASRCVQMRPDSSRFCWSAFIATSRYEVKICLCPSFSRLPLVEVAVVCETWSRLWLTWKVSQKTAAEAAYGFVLLWPTSSFCDFLQSPNNSKHTSDMNLTSQIVQLQKGQRIKRIKHNSHTSK